MRKHKKFWRTTAAVLLSAIVLCTVGYFVGGIGTPRAATEYRKCLANTAETAARAVRGAVKSDNNYENYQPIADIPETENGYIPQGYCFCEALNAFIISYYHAENASILSFTDKEIGAHTKTLYLQNADGTPFRGHAGGVADDAEYLYLCEDHSIFRIPLSEIAARANGAVLTLREQMMTDVKCSYINCDGAFLYAGEFYTYYADARYGTDKTHHMQISMNELHFSRCNAYRLADVQNAFSDTPAAPAVPAFALTTPNLVQGFARLSDGTFALSTSYGRNTDSHLLHFADVTKGESAYQITYLNEDIPVYSLSKDAQTECLRLPPLLEGIDSDGVQITGIFESGAQKYSNGKFPVNAICALG